MIAKIAYLTSPAPNRFLLHIQPDGATETIPYEISRAHLANLIIDGVSFSLRETSINRVPSNPNQESAENERAGT
jgi:hypothetical protein